MFYVYGRNGIHLSQRYEWTLERVVFMVQALHCLGPLNGYMSLSLLKGEGKMMGTRTSAFSYGILSEVKPLSRWITRYETPKLLPPSELT